jgi:hypothetical protein
LSAVELLKSKLNNVRKTKNEIKKRTYLYVKTDKAYVIIYVVIL